jgi:ABC-type ATPase involved in cell division
MTDAIPVLRATGIEKSFGGRKVLKGIDLDAAKGEVISILGGSGSGKSTFLRCLNLLEMPDAGEISIAGTPAPLVRDRHGALRVSDTRALGAMRARTAMVFQGFNLWSHMRVIDNVIAAPVHVHGMAREEAVERAHALLERVGMGGFAQHWPRQLSGGSNSGWRSRAHWQPIRTDAVRRADFGTRSRTCARSARSHALARRRRTHHAGRHARWPLPVMSRPRGPCPRGTDESMGPPAQMFGPTRPGFPRFSFRPFP